MGSPRGFRASRCDRRLQREYVWANLTRTPFRSRDCVQVAPDFAKNGDAVCWRSGRDRVRLQNAGADRAAACEGHLALINSRADHDAPGGGVSGQHFRELQGLEARF